MPPLSLSKEYQWTLSKQQVAGPWMLYVFIFRSTHVYCTKLSLNAFYDFQQLFHHSSLFS
jgi:hypothetical protein